MLLLSPAHGVNAGLRDIGCYSYPVCPFLPSRSTSTTLKSISSKFTYPRLGRQYEFTGLSGGCNEKLRPSSAASIITATNTATTVVGEEALHLSSADTLAGVEARGAGALDRATGLDASDGELEDSDEGDGLVGEVNFSG